MKREFSTGRVGIEKIIEKGELVETRFYLEPEAQRKLIFQIPESENKSDGTYKVYFFFQPVSAIGIMKELFKLQTDIIYSPNLKLGEKSTLLYDVYTTINTALICMRDLSFDHEGKRKVTYH